MNIVINCPHCNQEMVIDDSGVGQSVPCPTCSKDFVIPQGRPEEEVKKEREAAAATPKPEEKKEDKKPQMSKEELAALLPGAKKGGAKTEKKEDAPGFKVKTLQHHLCIDMGNDLFPKMAEDILNKIKREDLITCTPINYSYKNSGGDLIQDYGLVIVYEQKAGEEKDK